MITPGLRSGVTDVTRTLPGNPLGRSRYPQVPIPSPHSRSPNLITFPESRIRNSTPEKPSCEHWWTLDRQRLLEPCGREKIVCGKSSCSSKSTLHSYSCRCVAGSWNALHRCTRQPALIVRLEWMDSRRIFFNLIFSSSLA